MKALLSFLLSVGLLHSEPSSTSKVQAEFKPGSHDEFITITDGGGKVYKNARVVKVDADFILRFVHDDGAAALPLADFPSEVKARFRFDELKALKRIPSAGSVSVEPSSASRDDAGSGADAAAIIRLNAEKEWPGNFRMQKYEIEKQTEALIQCARISRDGLDGVPRSVVDQIMAKAQKGWGDNYRMVLFETKTQADAWKRVNSK